MTTRRSTPPRRSRPVTRTPGTTTTPSTTSRPASVTRSVPPRSPPPREASNAPGETAKPRSASVASSAATVRRTRTSPPLPVTPSAGSTSRNEAGGTVTRGTPVPTRGQRVRTRSPASQRRSCRMPQLLGSAPTTACPTPGTVTRVERGSSEAIRAEASGGVRRSSSPCSRSAGTSG